MKPRTKKMCPVVIINARLSLSALSGLSVCLLVCACLCVAERRGPGSCGASRVPVCEITLVWGEGSFNDICSSVTFILYHLKETVKSAVIIIDLPAHKRHS